MAKEHFPRVAAREPVLALYGRIADLDHPGDAELRDGGDILNIPIVSSLRGSGVSTGPLTGNEEKLLNYGMRLWVDWSRNAVLLTRAQMRKSSFEQLEIVGPLLTEWGNVLLGDEIVQAMGALPSETVPANLGNEATAGQRVNGHPVRPGVEYPAYDVDER